MYKELITNGKVLDDCDGYAVMIYYILRCLGYPKHRVYVRAGWVINQITGLQGEGHATCIIVPYFDPVNLYAVEGSYYPDKVNRMFHTFKKPMHLTGFYGKTWFVCNEDKSYKGDIYER
jgi:hypothetical protein